MPRGRNKPGAEQEHGGRLRIDLATPQFATCLLKCCQQTPLSVGSCGSGVLLERPKSFHEFARSMQHDAGGRCPVPRLGVRLILGGSRYRGHEVIQGLGQQAICVGSLLVPTSQQSTECETDECR